MDFNIFEEHPLFWEHPEIDDKLKLQLEFLYRAHIRVRIYYGDTVSGRDWNEEWMNFGYICRSTGTEKIPILVCNSRSIGGPAVLTNCIVKLAYASGGQVVWAHPKYFCNPHMIQPSAEPGYAEEVIRDNEVVARFSKPGQAAMWVDFMEGRRNNKG